MGGRTRARVDQGRELLSRVCMYARKLTALKDNEGGRFRERRRNVQLLREAQDPAEMIVGFRFTNMTTSMFLTQFEWPQKLLTKAFAPSGPRPPPPQLPTPARHPTAPSRPPPTQRRSQRRTEVSSDAVRRRLWSTNLWWLTGSMCPHRTATRPRFPF